ncbi:MAG: chemotaxis protein [Pseudomonadota bacterium]
MDGSFTPENTAENTVSGERRHDDRRPTSGEAAIRIEELFFSRTDTDGVIQSVNEAFQRVSNHPWEDIIGAPHNLVRHPDMPSGLFWLFWKMISENKPFGAYIKNRSADGLSFWVYSVVIPCPDGYLSVWLKPSTDMLEKTQNLYVELLRAEAEQEIDPEASCKELEGKLCDLGFANYQSFMAATLSAELSARASQLHVSADTTLEQFKDLSCSISEIEAITMKLSDTFSEIRGVPTNMRILASRLEAAGGPISVISANYSTMSDEIGAWAEQFLTDSNSAFGRIREALDTGLFLQGISLLQDEVCDFYRRERRRSAQDNTQAEADLKILSSQANACRKRASDGLDHVTAGSKRFATAVGEMKRLVTGLSSTRMMCKIEGARLRHGRDSLTEVIRQLDSFQDRVEEQLSKITDINRTIQAGTEALRQSFQ